MAWALFVAVRAAHEMPPRAETLPPPPSRWAPRLAVGEQGAAEDDAALWEWAAPRSAGEAARSFLHHCRDTALDVYAAFLAFASQLITVETVGVAAVAVGVVLAFARGFETGAGAGARHHYLVANLNWAVFASAVVFPLCVAFPRLRVPAETDAHRTPGLSRSTNPGGGARWRCSSSQSSRRTCLCCS